MALRSIIVWLDASSRTEERVRIAADLAATHEAHLIGLAPVALPPIPGPVAVEFGDAYLRQKESEARTQAQAAAQRFEAQVQRIGLGAYESRVVSGDGERALALHARYSDLAVIGQYDPSDRASPMSPDFPEYAVLSAGRPVLVVPYAGRYEKVGRDVVIAWSATRESARAVTDALPLLARAKRVRVLVFNAESTSAGHGAEPGADIALFLARHGVRVEVSQETTEVDVGSALLSRVADLGADLIVMGAYGHSRLRQVLVGGVSRTLLESMTVPVLMSH